MKDTLNIFEFDDQPLFVDYSIYRFLLSNLSKLQETNEFIDMFQKFESKHEVNSYEVEKLSIEEFYDLLILLRLKKDSSEFFYNLGNLNNSYHFQVSGYLNYFISHQDISKWTINNVQNIAKIQLMLNHERISVKVTFHKLIKEKHESIINPLTNLLKGFIDNVATIVFDCKTFEKQTHVSHIKEFELKDYIDSPSKLIEYVPLKHVLYNKLKSCINGKVELDLKDQITRLLARDLGFSIEEISKNLNMSVRTLQRNLKTSNQKFSIIKEDVRKELAVKHLENVKLSIDEISDLLGYSERSAFDRAFKKWYSINAKEYRLRFKN